MVLASIGYPNILLRWWPMFFVGSFLAEKVKLLLLRQSSKKNDISPLGEVKEKESNEAGSTQKAIPQEGDEEDGMERRES